MHGLLRVNAIVILGIQVLCPGRVNLLPCTHFIFIFNKLMMYQLTFHAIFIIFMK
jgi:hypothetical protein